MTENPALFHRFPKFLLTRPLRDVTVFNQFSRAKYCISTHTPLAGRDLSAASLFSADCLFLLTRPLRDVTAMPALLGTCSNIFLLTRPLRDVTGIKLNLTGVCRISTHTPLAGRDLNLFQLILAQVISTHTPLAGRDGKDKIVR